MELVLATNNKQKVREFKEMLKPYSQLEVLSLHHFPHFLSPDETGITFKENAQLKAENAARVLNCWVLADDSGLVVPALGGEPGVKSRRFSGENPTDYENCHYLLQRMALLKDDERLAYFECSLAIANPQGIQKCVSATCEGVIATAVRVGNGFGYDPVFSKRDYDKTFAELDEHTKNRISHRRKAFERIAIFLENLKGF